MEWDRFKNWNDYFQDSLYQEHLTILKRSNINLYPYSEIPDIVKLITIGILDQYASYIFFTLSNTKLEIDYNIQLHCCSLINSDYHIIDTYNIMQCELYQGSHHEFNVISINQDNPDRIDYVWFFDIDRYILVDLYSCKVFRCRFNDIIDWNNWIVPSHLFDPYISLHNTTLHEQLKRFIESAKLIYGTI